MAVCICKKKTEDVWIFENSEEASVFLLGRDIKKYLVYALVGVDLTGCDIDIIKRDIEDTCSKINSALRDAFPGVPSVRLKDELKR